MPLFEQVADVLRGAIGDDLGPWGYRAHRGGVKVWFGGATPTREHYEAQFLPARLAPGVDGPVLEVGFHAEHPKVADNDAALARLAQGEKRWRKSLGDEPEAGPFLGRPDDWRRVSEVWGGVDPDDPDLALEVGARLAEYVLALEPVRRA